MTFTSIRSVQTATECFVEVLGQQSVLEAGDSLGDAGQGTLAPRVSLDAQLRHIPQRVCQKVVFADLRHIFHEEAKAVHITVRIHTSLYYVSLYQIFSLP